jgi:hypothetical protein
MDENKFIRAVKFPSEPAPAYLQAWWDFKWWCYLKWPFNSYVSVTSFDEWARLPRSSKMVWGLFYRYHRVNTASGFLEGMNKNNQENATINSYKEFRWPIQYYIRETLGFCFIGSRISNFWYNQVSSRYNPRQKWLTKVIPRTWCDKPGLILIVNFAMVTNFVDGEKCFDNTEYEGDGEARETFAKELRACYNYIKVERPDLEKLQDGSYPEIGESSGSYEKDYAEVDRIEKLLTELDTKWLVWIVQNRDYLWT